MKPAWDELMEAMNTPEFNKNAIIGDIDCTVHADTCQTYGVQGYPTIKCVAARQLPRRAAPHSRLAPHARFGHLAPSAFD